MQKNAILSILVLAFGLSRNVIGQAAGGTDAQQALVNTGNTGNQGGTDNWDMTDTPTCPQDDKKAFMTKDGDYFRLQCSFHSDKGQTMLSKGHADSYEACMNTCAQTVSSKTLPTTSSLVGFSNPKLIKSLDLAKMQFYCVSSKGWRYSTTT